MRRGTDLALCRRNRALIGRRSSVCVSLRFAHGLNCRGAFDLGSRAILDLRLRGNGRIDSRLDALVGVRNGIDVVAHLLHVGSRVVDLALEAVQRAGMRSVGKHRAT